MSTLISVREYAWLTTASPDAAQDSLDCAKLTQTAFDHLCSLSESFRTSGAQLAQREGHLRLRLDNYVGVINTPCGTALEILPKHHTGSDSVAASRRLLRRMIGCAMDLPVRKAGEASLELFDQPLSEWLLRRYLEELERLLRRGVRFDYVRVEEQLPFLRGQLNLQAQLRRQPGHDATFNVRHDVYVADRPENRLLRLAVDICRRETRDADNWRLANELSARLTDVEASSRIDVDFGSWRSDRLMAHYATIRPWCEWVVSRTLPLALHGGNLGTSLLFPMERLFEAYVGRCLGRQVARDVRMRRHPSSLSLCRHEGSPLFALEPDLMAIGTSQTWILDAKWKLLDGLNKKDKYGLSQSDFYQLFAYGQKYLEGTGDMALIYPRTKDFQAPLPPFELSSSLRLWVLPFDLQSEQVLGLEKLGLPVAGAQLPFNGGSAPSPAAAA